MYGMDDSVLQKCAHCVSVKERLNIEGTYDAELIRRQVAATQAAHSRLCQRRW